LSNLNIQLNVIAYNDSQPNNNPAIKVFDFLFRNLGILVEKPIAQSIIVPPMATVPVFNGVRTTAIDSTTQFTVTQPNLISPNTYQFTATGGTPPLFRTPRAIGIDNTTVWVSSVNGPIQTLTYSAGTAPSLGSVQVGDILTILMGSGFSAPNWGTFTIVSVTSNSISYVNLNAIAETVTILDPTLFLVYSNGAAGNQIQIGDSVIISGGFSPADFGTYQIIAVTPTWFQINVGSPNGIPLESGIMPGTSGLTFYSSAQSFVLVAAQDRCAVQMNGDSSNSVLIEPVEANNPEKPGLLLKQGTVYSLSIQNLSINPLSVIVSSAE
jgi:hypothetical protein